MRATFKSNDEIFVAIKLFRYLRLFHEAYCFEVYGKKEEYYTAVLVEVYPGVGDAFKGTVQPA
jgi:hypothetical protein